MRKEIFAEIDSDTYQKLKIDDLSHNFLSTADYPVIEIAKKREVGRIHNVRLLLRTDIKNIISASNYFINEIEKNLGNNIAARMILSDFIKHLKHLLGKDEY